MQDSKPQRPTDVVQSAGLSDLSELAFLTEQSEQTLINWFNNPKKRVLFDCVVLGAAVKRHESTRSPSQYWVYGQRRLQAKHDISSEKYAKALYQFAVHCVERFPESIGHPDNVGRGTPHAIIECIERTQG